MKNLVALFTVFYSGAECFLKDFLSSLKEQSYKEFDLIIVNDGFEVGEFENLLCNLNVVEIKFSSTVSKNREYGLNYIKRAGYKYLILCDVDDFFSRKRVEISLNMLREFDVVVNDVDIVSNRNEILINKMKKIALISGITGQDGSFLAEFLIEKGYEVHGILRRSSSFNTARIEHLYLDEWVRDMKKDRLVNLHYGDMTDSSSLIRIIQQVQPDEIYNLAAQSHVKVSFDVPEYTAEADAIGTLRMLEAVRILGMEKKTRIYQASTSELFGLVQEVPQKETTPFYPRSPYGVAKQYGFWITKNYRESYGMYAVNGILFNHESERRGETFVTRKITLAAARIAQGLQDKLYLGNLNSLRDWGYAKDYVECMWLILQHDTPEDFVIATGEYHTVREFTTLAFKEVDIELRWEGEGVNEKGIDVASGKVLVEVDSKYFRPAEVEQLLGDPTKARMLLGWNPTKTSFPELVKIMVSHDMKFVKKLHMKELMNREEG